MEINLNESAFKRAKRDTLSAFHTFRFWIFGLCIGAALTIMVLLWIPSGIQGGWQIVYQVLVPLIGVILGLATVFGVFLLKAPYKQRNEARKRVIELESEREKKANLVFGDAKEQERVQLRSDIALLIIEGTNVLNGFKSVHIFGDALPTEEFKVWCGKVTELLDRYKRSEDYALWFRDVYINVGDSLLEDFVVACEAGLDRLESILETLRG